MADVNATELTTKTTPAGTDDLILFGQNTNVGYKIDYDDLAAALWNNHLTKTLTTDVGTGTLATLFNTLNSNTVQSVNGSQAATLSLQNCTGTLSHNLHYHLNGHILYMFGRIFITDFQRTGLNPGVEVTIPSSKSLDGGVNVSVGGLVSVGSHIYATENVSVLGDDGASVFRLRATESKTNITGTGVFTMLVPPFFVRVK